MQCSGSSCCRLPRWPSQSSSSFHSSRLIESLNYLAAVKPFVDAVNAEASGVVEIEVFPSGALGKNYAGVAQQVLNGTVDIGWVSPSLTPDRFPDNTVMELPGLFRDASEATFVYTRIIASEAMKGYERLLCRRSLRRWPARHPHASANRFPQRPEGQEDPANQPDRRRCSRAFGVTPEDMPGQPDGAFDYQPGQNRWRQRSSPVTLVEFGTARSTSYHYFLDSRSHTAADPDEHGKKFDSLPTAAQDVIRKYSGEWLAARFTKSRRPSLRQSIDETIEIRSQAHGDLPIAIGSRCGSRRLQDGDRRMDRPRPPQSRTPNAGSRTDR